jgi:hypothetical protein
MRISSLIGRTKKFFSKRRRVARAELGDIHADGLSRRKMEEVSRAFQSTAVNHESNAAFFKFKEMSGRKIIHDNRFGRSDEYRNPSSVPRDPIQVKLEVETNRATSNKFSRKAKEIRQKAVMRRLYSLRALRKEKKN